MDLARLHKLFWDYLHFECLFINTCDKFALKKFIVLKCLVFGFHVKCNDCGEKVLLFKFLRHCVDSHNQSPKLLFSFTDEEEAEVALVVRDSGTGFMSQYLHFNEIAIHYRVLEPYLEADARDLFRSSEHFLSSLLVSCDDCDSKFVLGNIEDHFSLHFVHAQGPTDIVEVDSETDYFSVDDSWTDYTLALDPNLQLQSDAKKKKKASSAKKKKKATKKKTAKKEKDSLLSDFSKVIRKMVVDMFEKAVRRHLPVLLSKAGAYALTKVHGRHG